MATMSATNVSLLTIPQELAEHILQFSTPDDLANLAATCRHMRDIIYNSDDQAVWRMVYLAYPFDDPCRALGNTYTSNAEIDWRGLTQRRVAATKLMRTQDSAPYISFMGKRDPSKSPATAADEEFKLLRALETLIAAVRNAPVWDDTLTPSHDLQWVEATLLDSPLFQLVDKFHHRGTEGDWNTPDCARQLMSRLQCYLALSHAQGHLLLPDEEGRNEDTVLHLRALRTASRCVVYDLRNYQAETCWGPYNLDARGRVRVNWEHVKHIQDVVLLNLRDHPPNWTKVWPKWGFESTRAYSAPGVQDRKPWDWAGVEGKWRRVVCFMDYRDLSTFNFSSSDGGPRNPKFFEHDFTEAVRLMEAQLTVLDPPASSPLTEGNEPDDTWDPAYPPIHFEGASRGIHSGVSRIRGTVRMLREGVVRWTFILGLWNDQVTAYDDATNRWRFSADAVQVGNVGSALGIAGVWTVAEHEGVEDPAGPFWMWKAGPDALPMGLQMLQ